MTTKAGELRTRCPRADRGVSNHNVPKYGPLCLRGMELDGDGGWGKENDEPERSSLKARVPGSTPRELSFRPTRALRVGPKRMLGKLGPRAGKRDRV